MPVRVVRAKAGCGRLVGCQAKECDRRCTPVRPVPCRGRGMDEPPKPAHRARRMGPVIIAGAGKHRNRHHPRHPAPILPLVELRQRIRDVKQGPDGLLYVLTDQNPGAILRIEPSK